MTMCVCKSRFFFQDQYFSFLASCSFFIRPPLELLPVLGPTLDVALLCSSRSGSDLVKYFRFWKRFETKWLTGNSGTRKRHGAARNLGNEKVVSSISAWTYQTCDGPPGGPPHLTLIILITKTNRHYFNISLNLVLGDEG